MHDVESLSDISSMEEDDEETIMHTSYDVFIKDSGVSTGFFKQYQAFKMFPVYETRARIDDYGEIIDLSEFRKFEVVAPADVEMEVDLPSTNEKVPEIIESPVKYTVENIILSLRCKLQYIDFEGRSDSRSIKNVLQHVGPKRLV